MERWQAEKLKRARKDIDQFIAKAKADREKLDRQIRAAEGLRRQFGSIEDFA